MKRITYWPQAVLGTFRNGQRQLPFLLYCVRFQSSPDAEMMTRLGVQLGGAPRLVCSHRCSRLERLFTSVRGRDMLDVGL